ncbi:unnamed protein product [Owenia fusiformis]|uniref:Carbohydrate sulfotransferase n=1 Tax=Owenia fusiformis TaxID=6347 RepID=A0A8J1TJF6_OWEFU|nr:unnamed protein product [Owenia fusiformis]
MFFKKGVIIACLLIMAACYWYQLVIETGTNKEKIVKRIWTHVQKVYNSRYMSDLPKDISSIQEKRIQHLQKMCIEYRKSKEYKHPTLIHNLFYIKNLTFPPSQTTNRALWCPCFKAGHSSWINTLQELNANNSGFKFDLRENINKTLTTVRFINVRDPWERLLSAYSNRMTYQENSKYISRQRNTIGRRIMSRYYPDSNAMNIPYENISFTFKDFLRFIIDEPKQLSGRLDDHWVQYYEWCRPCDPYLDYNAIVKLETVTEDSNYVLEKIGVKTKIKDGPRKTAKYLQEQYKEVPHWIIDDLTKIFYWDFKLFDYDMNSPLVRKSIS